MNSFTWLFWFLKIVIITETEFSFRVSGKFLEIYQECSTPLQTGRYQCECRCIHMSRAISGRQQHVWPLLCIGERSHVLGSAHMFRNNIDCAPERDACKERLEEGPLSSLTGGSPLDLQPRTQPADAQQPCAVWVVQRRWGKEEECKPGAETRKRLPTTTRQKAWMMSEGIRTGRQRRLRRLAVWRGMDRSQEGSVLERVMWWMEKSSFSRDKKPSA